MTVSSLWLMHTFLPSITLSLITTQRWRAAIVKSRPHLLALFVGRQQRSALFSSWSNETTRKRNDWQRSNFSLTPLYWSLWLGCRQILAAKKAHAPDCMPLLMGKPFSMESCGKAVHFLFSCGVVNSTFFGRPSGSLLKGSVMAFLQSGYASDRCVRPESCWLLVERVSEVPDNHAHCFLEKLLCSR